MPDHFPFLATHAGRAGLTIAVASVGAIVFVAHHPVVGPSSPDVLGAIDALRGIDAVVHGGLIVLLLMLALAFGGFVDHLGAARAGMRAGLFLYRVGCLAAVGAALVDGFVIPDIARHFLHAPIDARTIAIDLIVVAGFWVQVASKLAFLLIGVGVAVWGVVLLRGRGAARGLGAIGVLAGLVPTLVLLGTGLILRPASLLGILAAQAVWNVGVAMRLMRGEK